MKVVEGITHLVGGTLELEFTDLGCAICTRRERRKLFLSWEQAAELFEALGMALPEIEARVIEFREGAERQGKTQADVAADQDAPEPFAVPSPFSLAEPSPFLSDSDIDDLDIPV